MPLLIPSFSGFGFLGSGGGPPLPYTPLVPGADPANQVLPSGSTTTSVTFAASSGGSGAYSYSAALDQIVGSGASIAGSGLGPYTVSGLADGAEVQIILTTTDTGPVAQTVTAQCIITVDFVYAPLVASANPADQALPAGSTASAPASFTAPTGGSGAYSYAASIVQSVGTGATLSGSGLGPYTVSGLSAGDVVEVTLVSTDTGPVAQTVRNNFVVSVDGAVSRLVPGANPATVTASGASVGGITFNAPTGGSGSYSYSVAPPTMITGGSSQTVSGSGLGPYTVGSIAVGDVSRLVLTITDTGGLGQVVRNWVIIDYPLPYTPLSPGTTPAAQSLAAGTTQSNLITFVASTGGRTPLVYTPSIQQLVGTGATLAGSGRSNLQVQNMEDGDVIAVFCVTQDGIGQQVTRVTYVTVGKVILTPGAAPANQTLPAGTTTSGAVTFTAATGGSGSYTYSAALVQTSGTGASLTGSGLGPYTVSGLADDDVVTVILTSTDAAGIAQAVTTTVIISVGFQATYTALVPGADPADQPLPAGSTSVSGITFTAPTGGSGGYSYAASLETAAGTPALSGSGLGPYGVTGLADGDIATIELTATDTGPVGQAVKAYSQVAVAVPTAAAQWQTIVDQSLVGLDAGGPWSTGTQNLQFGGVTWATIEVVRAGVSNGTVSAGPAGVTLTASTGSGAIVASINLAPFFVGLAAGDFQKGPWLLQMINESVTVAGANNYCMWGIGTANSLTDIATNTAYVQFVSPNYNLRTWRAGVSTQLLSSAPASPVSSVVSVLLYGGRLAFIQPTLDTTTLPANPADSSGYNYTGTAAQTSATAQYFTTAINAFQAVIGNGSTNTTTLTRVRLLRWL